MIALLPQIFFRCIHQHLAFFERPAQKRSKKPWSEGVHAVGDLLELAYTHVFVFVASWPGADWNLRVLALETIYLNFELPAMATAFTLTKPASFKSFSS